VDSESLWQKFKRLVRKPRKVLLRLHARDLEKGEWLRRYGIPASLLLFLNKLVFFSVYYHQLFPPSFQSHFVLVFIAIQLSLGIIIIASFLRASGKWGYLFLAIGVAVVAFIAVLAYYLSKI